MNVFCEVCGDVGWEELILHCNKCKNVTRHQYCFDPVIYDGSLVEWLCDDCLPNGNEVRNLLDISNQRKSSQTELGFSITKETNVKKKLTKGLWSWGHHRNRSFKARCDGSDSRTKHFASGNAFSSEMFTEEMSKINECEMEGRGKNEYSSHSTLDHASRADQHINIHNPMGSLKPSLNSIKGLNLSDEKDDRFSSPDHVEGSIPQGWGGLFSSVNDVERAHLMIEDGSNPTFTSVEHMDLVHKKQLLQPSSLETNSMGTSIPCLQSMDVLHKKNMELLKPSPLDKKYLDKSVPNSENMDVVLMERSCPLNNPMGIHAKRVVTKVDPIEPSRQFDQACLEVSSKAHEIHEADAGSKGAQSLKNGKPKKQRRLILPYDEDEDAEPIQVHDVNCQSCGIDGQAKKPVEIVTALEDINAECGQNVCSQLALPTIAVKGQCGLSSTPFIPKYFCVQPIDEPNWTGIMKIGMDYIPMGAYFSNKACKKVCELSMSLPQIMKVTELPMSKAWPKSWEEASVPTAESIGLFFFLQNTRSNKEFDDLVKHVIDCDIVLETDVSFAKLLVFPSVVLPAEYRVFQGKHYLWGVFKRSKDMSERDALRTELYDMSGR